MLILRSHAYAVRFLEFYPESGQYTEISTELGHEAEKSKAPKFETNGVYDFLSHQLVALYTFNGRMFLSIAEHVIPVNDIVSFELNAQGIISTFHLATARSTYSLRYKNSSDQLFEDDLTPFIEAEDFDFGLFIKNILVDQERQARLLDCWGNESHP